MARGSSGFSATLGACASCGGASVPMAAPLLGGRILRAVSEETSAGAAIGPFRIVAPLESGGMASLFLAHRPPSRDIVAIKVIRDQLREVPRMIRMFQDEARTLTHVDHKNVVRVLEAGEYPDGRYLAMEYVHGCTLARLVDELEHRGLELPIAVGVQIAIEVATALHAAHEAVDENGRPLNIVHRDVSPQNVMISETGRVKLIDFGVAKASGRLEVTNAKLIKGKLRYMAPEQASGKPIDRRTDIFSLGILLWEMLTSHRFATGEGDIDVFTRLLDPKPTPPSEDNPAVSPALDAAVLGALSKSPQERPATGLELAEALRSSTDVSEGSSALEALVTEMFGVELAYTREWIAESFVLADPEIFDEHPVFDEAHAPTLRMGREVLAALAAKKLSSGVFDLVDSESSALTEPDWRDEVTKNQRPPKQATQTKARPRLDLTFTLLPAKGPESTGARPILSPYEGPSVVSDPPLGGGFDVADDTDALAVQCLANLRHATWAGRPAGAPPSLSVIAPLEGLEGAPVPSPPPERFSRLALVVLGLAVVLLCLAGFGTAWLVFY